MSADKLTKPQQSYLDQVRLAGRLVLNGRARRPIEALANAGLVSVDWDMRLQAKGNGMEATTLITVTKLCGTVGCGRAVTELITYRWRNCSERDTEMVCSVCADGYERRVAMASFTRRPLFEGMLQVWRRSWTASVDARGSWEDLRSATRAEIALMRTIPDGGSAFWLRSDGSSYYAPGARSNADQMVRIVR